MTVDAIILKALREAGEASISGTDLSQTLGISRAAVWARIEELRGLGYVIEANPHQGYRLISVPDRLNPDDLISRLGKVSVVGRDIRVFEQTTSTNDIVEKLARDGVCEGIAVFAESQTKGRGRLGRKWASPERKGLWFSILLRPKLRPQAVTQLTLMAATSLCRAIRAQTGLLPEIKWPNDLLIRGKKIAGILTELSGELDTVNSVILGIGLNVNLQASELAELRKTATSLKIETGQQVDRPELAAAALRELDRDYARLISGDFASIAEEWEERCHTLGQQISIAVGDRIIQGRAEAVDADGALLVRTQYGRLERIIGGDVRITGR